MRFPIPRLLLVLSLAALWQPWAAAQQAAPGSTPAPAAQQKVPYSPTKWEKDIAALEAKDQENPPGKGAIVFVGSSSIRRWTTLQEDFPRHRVLNRGFGGSQLSDAVYFADRIVTPYAPRMIVVYSGGNDINAGKTPEQIFTAFQEFVAKVRAKLPETPVAYISIAGNPKRWAQIEAVKKTNALIADYIGKHPNLKYIDVYTKMLGPDGQPLPDIFVADRLHMNAKGYEIWTGIVGAHLPAPDR